MIRWRSVLSIFKRLTYRSELKKLIQVLGLREISRKLYYQWAKPQDGILPLKLGEISARFHVPTTGTLRYLEGIFFSKELILRRLLFFLQPGDTVYEIGAHIGFSTCFFAKAVGDKGWVIAFEPDTQCFKHLQENIRLNNLTNVQLFRLALGEQEQEVRLFLGRDSNGEVTSSSSMFLTSTSRNNEVVKVVEGDRVVASEKLPLPRLIQINVEGYEYSVLKGLLKTISQPICEMVLVWVHPWLLPAQVKPEAILELLRSADFLVECGGITQTGEPFVFAYKKCSRK